MLLGTLNVEFGKFNWDAAVVKEEKKEINSGYLSGSGRIFSTTSEAMADAQEVHSGTAVITRQSGYHQREDAARIARAISDVARIVFFQEDITDSMPIDSDGGEWHRMTMQWTNPLTGAQFDATTDIFLNASIINHDIDPLLALSWALYSQYEEYTLVTMADEKAIEWDDESELKTHPRFAGLRAKYAREVARRHQWATLIEAVAKFYPNLGFLEFCEFTATEWD